VERLSSLAYRVNDYLREPAGVKAPVNISALLAETSQRICGLTPAHLAPAFIYANEDRIRSILENVMRNAIESGSSKSDITVSLNITDSNAIINISDRGEGIDSKNLKNIYDPFFTGKSTGTGIGLAISKRFTEAAGGSINAENRKEGGLAVTLVFPLHSGNY
jgi:signal transduction histidine kinase